MPLSLKQARRMVAKSRRRLYRQARVIIGPAMFGAWLAHFQGDPRRRYTPDEKAWKLCAGWLPGYCHNERQRAPLRAALGEFRTRRLRAQRMEANDATR